MIPARQLNCSGAEGTARVRSPARNLIKLRVLILKLIWLDLNWIDLLCCQWKSCGGIKIKSNSIQMLHHSHWYKCCGCAATIAIVAKCFFETNPSWFENLVICVSRCHWTWVRLHLSWNPAEISDLASTSFEAHPKIRSGTFIYLPSCIFVIQTWCLQQMENCSSCPCPMQKLAALLAVQPEF